MALQPLLPCPTRQRLLCDHQDVERLPRLRQESHAGRQFADTLALARMPRGENHGKQRPAQLDLPCQIDAVHRGLLRQKSVEQYLAAHGDMTWSADFLADDWTRINDSEVARRAISRVEARGKGILLLHDIHPRTVLALPEI